VILRRSVDNAEDEIDSSLSNELQTAQMESNLMSQVNQCHMQHKALKLLHIFDKFSTIGPIAFEKGSEVALVNILVLQWFILNTQSINFGIHNFLKQSSTVVKYNWLV
jgi:hypothetical protein